MSPLASDEEACGDLEDGLFVADGHWATAPGVWARDPREAAEQADFLRILRECLDLLPTRQQSAFVLRLWDGEDVPSCAEALSVTANHFSVLLHRARLQIRECLSLRYFLAGDKP